MHGTATGAEFALLAVGLLLIVLGEVGFRFGFRALRYFVTPPRRRRHDSWTESEDRG